MPESLLQASEATSSQRKVQVLICEPWLENSFIFFLLCQLKKKKTWHQNCIAVEQLLSIIHIFLWEPAGETGHALHTRKKTKQASAGSFQLFKGKSFWRWGGEGLIIAAEQMTSRDGRRVHQAQCWCHPAFTTAALAYRATLPQSCFLLQAGLCTASFQGRQDSGFPSGVKCGRQGQGREGPGRAVWVAGWLPY